MVDQFAETGPGEVVRTLSHPPRSTPGLRDEVDWRDHHQAVRDHAPPSSHVCYVRRMLDVASRELRNNTRALLDRVEAGESVTITVDGRPAAVLEPVARRPHWITRDEFVRRVLPRQADPALAAELRALAPETTDDLRPL